MEIIATHCPGCNASRNKYHSYGCPLESCPECGNRLLKCSCMVLSVMDELRLVKTIAKTLTREQVLSMADTSKHLDKNYLEKGGFAWILDNMSPELKEEADQMAQEILGAKRQGDKFLVPEDKAIEVLGMTQEEVAPILRELETECLYPGWEHKTGPLQ